MGPVRKTESSVEIRNGSENWGATREWKMRVATFCEMPGEPCKDHDFRAIGETALVLFCLVIGSIDGC